MAHQIIGVSEMKKVSKHDPCPICGKPDWCYLSTSTYSFSEGANEDFDFISCRRSLESQIYGQNGNFYIYDRTTGDGVHIYEDVLQRAHRHKRMGIDDSVNSPKGYVVKKSKTKTVLCEKNLASVERRDTVYRALLDMLILEQHHLNYLQKEKWDNQMITDSMYKSLPPQGFELSSAIKKRKSGDKLSSKDELILSLKNKTRKSIAQELYLKFGDLEGIPGFFLNQNKYTQENYWDISTKMGILMPMYDVHGRIFSLRIRLDFPNENEGKYKSLSSYYEQLISETDNEKVYDNPMKKGSNSPLNVSYLFPDYNTPFLIVTEGEKKQRVVVHKKKVGCCNVPGVASFKTLLNDVEHLKELGIKFIIIAYDADKAKNVMVLRAELNLIQALLEEGFEIFIAGWSEAFGKGIDDVLLSGNDITYDTLEEYLNKFEELLDDEQGEVL